MAIPWQVRVLDRLLGIGGTELADLTPAQIPAARESRRKLIRLPLAWLVVGRVPSECDVRDDTAELADGTVLPIRIYRPRGSTSGLPVVVNFHGGGFVFGDARQSDWWCASVAVQAAVVVVSVDYRLAPEFPFPTPPEDCYAALRWVVAHAADLRADAGRLAVMGDSAGGNLAAVVALMARDRGGPPIAAQILLYPGVELIDTLPSELENADAPILTEADILAFSALYRDGNEDPNEYGSPLRAPSHADLPAALVQTARHDPLRDHGWYYARALEVAGVPVRYTEYADAVHGYISVPGVVPAARQALAEAVAELRHRLIGP